MKITFLSALVTVLLSGAPAFGAGTKVKLAISNVPPGSIVIRHREAKLYYVISRTHAIRYPVAVPKPGAEWWGATQVVSKDVSPAWSPPAVVRAANPNLPYVIPGGSPNNPMGTRVMMLGLPEIAIHGTSPKMRSSVLEGRKASFGCIRMLNEDIQKLFNVVLPGTQVVMLR